MGVATQDQGSARREGSASDEMKEEKIAEDSAQKLQLPGGCGCGVVLSVEVQD